MVQLGSLMLDFFFHILFMRHFTGNNLDMQIFKDTVTRHMNHAKYVTVEPFRSLFGSNDIEHNSAQKRNTIQQAAPPLADPP